MAPAGMCGIGGHICVRLAGVAMVLFCRPFDGFAQTPRDPLVGVALGGIANVAREGVRAFVVISQVSSEIERDLVTARAHYWATYPAGPGHEQARARFSALLRSKDEFYLMSEVLKVGGPGDGNPNAPSLLTLPAGGVDGGISRAGQNAFMDWANEIVRQLRMREGLLAHWSVLAQPGRAEAIIAAAEPRYRAYAVRRDLDEFRRAGRRPPSVDAETWQLAALAIRADVPDPYAAAVAAAALPTRFMASCPAGLNGFLGGVAPGSCACARNAFREVLDPRLMWSLETQFTPEEFLLASFSRVGLHERITACVRG